MAQRNENENPVQGTGSNENANVPEEQKEADPPAPPPVTGFTFSDGTVVPWATAESNARILDCTPNWFVQGDYASQNIEPTRFFQIDEITPHEMRNIWIALSNLLLYLPTCCVLVAIPNPSQAVDASGYRPAAIRRGYFYLADEIIPTPQD